MIIDIDKYKINKEFVQKMYREDKFGLGIGYHISSLACSTMVPCIVIAYWIGEASNWHQETIDAIIRLKKFYGYTDVLNKPEGAPV